MAEANWSRRIALAAVILAAFVAAYFLGRFIIYGGDHFTIEQTTPVISRVDGLKYRVHEVYQNPQVAADTLAELNERVIDLMRALKRKYLLPDGSYSALGKQYPARAVAVKRLLNRYNPDNLAENSPDDPSGDTSYTIDKGSIVALCLRGRGDAPPDIQDLNTLIFVTLHEMSHIATIPVDHPPEFWETFKFLLLEAEAAGVYVSPNYGERPRRYCGVNIDYNPRYDSTLDSI